MLDEAHALLDWLQKNNSKNKKWSNIPEAALICALKSDTFGSIYIASSAGINMASVKKYSAGLELRKKILFHNENFDNL